MGKSFKILALVVVLLALPVALFLILKSGPADYRARAGQPEGLLVFLMPTQATMILGEEVDFEVKIDTGQQAVSGGEILINFDSDQLAMVGEVEKGSAFERVATDAQAGQIVVQAKGQLIGQGTIASFRLKALAEGETKLAISPQSKIWDEKGNTNLLHQYKTVQIRID